MLDGIDSRTRTRLSFGAPVVADEFVRRSPDESPSSVRGIERIGGKNAGQEERNGERWMLLINPPRITALFIARAMRFFAPAIAGTRCSRDSE